MPTPADSGQSLTLKAATGRAQEQLCRVRVRGEQVVLELSGHWRLSRLTELSGALRFGDLGPLVTRAWSLDGSQMRSVDTAAVKKGAPADKNNVAGDVSGSDNSDFAPAPDRARVIRARRPEKKCGVTGQAVQYSFPSPLARPCNASVRPTAARLCVAPSCANAVGAAHAPHVP